MGTVRIRPMPDHAGIDRQDQAMRDGQNDPSSFEYTTDLCERLARLAEKSGDIRTIHEAIAAIDYLRRGLEPGGMVAGPGIEPDPPGYEPGVVPVH